jgi:hypothetical protein
MGRRWAINKGSRVKPDLRKLHVRLAHFVGMRFARPSEAFFGHRPILGGRFHDSTPLSSKVRQVLTVVSISDIGDERGRFCLVQVGCGHITCKREGDRDRLGRRSQLSACW